MRGVVIYGRFEVQVLDRPNPFSCPRTRFLCPGFPKVTDAEYYCTRIVFKSHLCEILV